MEAEVNTVTELYEDGFDATRLKAHLDTLQTHCQKEKNIAYLGTYIKSLSPSINCA